jgi:hypothetical protein
MVAPSRSVDTSNLSFGGPPVVARVRQLFSPQRFRSAVYGALFRLLNAQPFKGRQFVGHKILKVTRAPEKGPEFRRVLHVAGPETRVLNDGEPDGFVPKNYPELTARAFENALISANPRLTAAIVESELIIPAVADEGPWKIDVGTPTHGGMKYLRDSSMLVRVKTRKPPLEKGIFVGTWSPHNWFHWIIDTLPTVFFAQELPSEFDELPLLLPRSVSSKGAWLEPLDLVSNGRKIEFVLEPHSYTQVSQLLWLDSPTSPGPISRSTPEEGSLKIHRTALAGYRDFVIKSLELEPHPSPERVFLARSPSGNRPYNQDALVRIASTFGFETVFLDTLNFADSVRAVVSAKFIVGPHGAGWANTLFNTSGASALMWTWRQGANRNWFANVAKVAGIDMRVIFTDSQDSLELKGENPRSRSHDLPEKLFAATLEKMLT